MSWTENEKLNEWIERAYENGKHEEQERIVALIERLPFIWGGTTQMIQTSRDDVIALIRGETND